MTQTHPNRKNAFVSCQLSIFQGRPERGIVNREPKDSVLLVSESEVGGRGLKNRVRYQFLECISHDLAGSIKRNFFYIV
jgi:hypothetical protein